VRQRNAVAEHGADDRFTLHHRSMKLRIDKAFLQQLLTQLGEQRLLIHRLIDHPEMGGIEVLIQHPRTGAVHQHQLADLIQLIVGGNGAMVTTGLSFSLIRTVEITKSASIASRCSYSRWEIAAISSCGYLRCRIASIIRTIALLVSHTSSTCG
jgi:hypothetical protein